jgi:hypothetical protein
MEIQKQYGLRSLADSEREMLISRLPPHYMIHAYANCFDRDERRPDFVPWTYAFHSASDRTAWIRDRSQCVRLSVQAVLVMMRKHLTYLSEQECARARAPYKLPKDILRQAFWRVDPHHTGYTSMAQFMQVNYILFEFCISLSYGRRLSCCTSEYEVPERGMRIM